MSKINESNDKQLLAVCDFARKIGSDLIIVMMTRSRKPGVRGVRLYGRSGPVGEVLGSNRLTSGKIRVVARFHVSDVEDAIARSSLELAT